MSFISSSRNKVSRGRALAGAVLLVLTVAGTVAGAKAAEVDATGRVRIGEFNLNTDAGSRAAFGALASASRRVCRVGESRLLSDAARAQACFEQALGNAVQEVRSERLTQLFRAKGKMG
jgi:UrcA family protein